MSTYEAAHQTLAISAAIRRLVLLLPPGQPGPVLLSTLCTLSETLYLWEQSVHYGAGSGKSGRVF